MDDYYERTEFWIKLKVIDDTLFFYNGNHDECLSKVLHN